MLLWSSILYSARTHARTPARTHARTQHIFLKCVHQQGLATLLSQDGFFYKSYKNYHSDVKTRDASSALHYILLPRPILLPTRPTPPNALCSGSRCYFTHLLCASRQGSTALVGMGLAQYLDPSLGLPTTRRSRSRNARRHALLTSNAPASSPAFSAQHRRRRRQEVRKARGRGGEGRRERCMCVCVHARVCVVRAYMCAYTCTALEWQA